MAFSDNDLDDCEFPDEDIDDDLAETDTRDCTGCGARVYEDAQQCPHCGSWLTADSSPWSGRAWWWIALGAAGVIALVWVLSVGGP